MTLKQTDFWSGICFLTFVSLLVGGAAYIVGSITVQNNIDRHFPAVRTTEVYEQHPAIVQPLPGNPADSRYGGRNPYAYEYEENND